MDKPADLILEIENLPQSSEKSSGSPKVTKALSRKGSSRNERRNSEEQEAEESSRKLVVKVQNSQLEPLMSAKPQMAIVTTTVHGYGMIESTDGRSKRFNRFSIIHPKRILLIFATLSSMGTIILIYFTLTISKRGGA